MSKELIEAAGALADTLTEENAALVALDLPVFNLPIPRSAR